MTYRIPLPAGGYRNSLDVIDPFSSMVQRFLRREGLGAYERETAATLLALCDQRDAPFQLFDVGANIGLYSHLCAAMFANARVTSFEPTPEIAEIARTIASVNGLAVEVVEAAVSDESGTADLHLSQTSDASNSLVEGFKLSDGSVRVERLRLDDHVASTGVGPDILKIDVETHEPAVLAGAREVITEHRPHVVIEVLRRRGVDQGAEIQSAFEGLGYVFYELSGDPTWTPRDSIRGSGTIERDWLLAPAPLSDDFGDRWSSWSDALAACTPDRNSRPPIVGAARAAYDRGGLGELMRSGAGFFMDDVVSPAVDAGRRARSSWQQRRNL